MEALIEKLHEALVCESPEWEWKLSCAPPQAGQQRIKISARSIEKSEICRTMIFTKALCKALPPPELALHIRKRLHCLLAENQERKLKPFATHRKKPARKIKTLKTHYKMMLRCYQTTLAYLRYQEVLSGSRMCHFN